ncbi:MAG: MFS transporter [Planctomycetes bacterium]|nr:MFS transporter [Planctomycetota bacterium]
MQPRTKSGGAGWALALLTVVYAFNFADRQLLSIALDDIKRDLEVSDAQMGWLTGTAFALFYTCAGIGIARVADRGRRWTVLGVGLALWSALTSLSGLARSFTDLALMRVGVGVGEAACTPPAHSLLSDLYAPAKRATAIAVYSTGIYLGIFLAYDVGGWVCEQWSWRTALVVFGLPGLPLAALAGFAMREPRRESVAVASRASTWADLRALVTQATFVHLALGAGIKSIAGYALSTWMPTFYGRVHGFGPLEAGAWLGPILGLGGALGTFGGGWLADRLGRGAQRRRMQCAGGATLVALPFLYASLFVESSSASLALYAVATVLGAMYLGPVFALTLNMVRPDQRALASATLLFLINVIGLGLGPWLVGVLNDALAAQFGAQAVRWSLALIAVTYAWGAAHMLRAAE